MAVLLMAGGNRSAFEFAASAVKQMLALSTGIIGLTLTFFGQNSVGISSSAKGFLIAAWFVLAGSILFGVLSLMLMVGSLDKHEKPTVYWVPIRVAAAVQIILFAVGVIIAVIAGAKSI